MSDDDDLSGQHELQARVEFLERAAQVDHDLITHLEHDGVLARGSIANLEQALVTCRGIGAATGILMATARVSQGEAFESLKQASQRSNRKLRDVAEDVVFTGSLPTD